MQCFTITDNAAMNIILSADRVHKLLPSSPGQDPCCHMDMSGGLTIKSHDASLSLSYRSSGPRRSRDLGNFVAIITWPDSLPGWGRQANGTKAIAFTITAPPNQLKC